MAKTEIPQLGGSFTIDPKGKVSRQGGTKMPDQAAERLAAETPAEPTPAPAAEEEKP